MLCRRRRCFDAVVVRHTPDEPDQREVVFAAQVKAFLDDLRGCLVGRILEIGL